MAKFCSNCGEPLEEGARFCPACGTPVQTAAPEQPQMPAQTYAQPEQPAAPAQIYAQPEQPAAPAQIYAQPEQPAQIYAQPAQTYQPQPQYQPRPQYQPKPQYQPQQAYQPQPVYGQPYAPAKPAKKGGGVIIAVIAAVLAVIAIGAVCFFGFREGGFFRGGAAAQGKSLPMDRVVGTYEVEGTESWVDADDDEYNFTNDVSVKLVFTRAGENLLYMSADGYIYGPSSYDPEKGTCVYKTEDDLQVTVTFTEEEGSVSVRLKYDQDFTDGHASGSYSGKKS